MTEIHRNLSPIFLEKITTDTSKFNLIHPSKKPSQNHNPTLPNMFEYTHGNELSHLILGGMDHVCARYGFSKFDEKFPFPLNLVEGASFSNPSSAEHLNDEGFF